MPQSITLPPRTDGENPIVLSNASQVTVIGANGAGKTRFCMRILHDAGKKAFRISALHAIYVREQPTEAPGGSIDALFIEADRHNHYLKTEASTEFERLIFLLLHEEFLDMLKYKSEIYSDTSKRNRNLPITKLDKVIARWEEIFPNNKILREGGRLLFTSGSGDDLYSSLKLSDGEKAILYYLGAVLYAPQGAVVLIDDPGVFIHHSIMQALWNVIEQLRSDCTFIYNTHDIDFAVSRINNYCVWVKSFDALKSTWDYQLLQSDQNLSEDLFADLLGSRKPVLFIEGDARNSIDSKLYQLVFTEYTVKPLGSCNKVIESTRSFNDLTGFHHLDSHGIVDRDRRDDREVAYLRKRKILVPDVAEIENIMLLPGVITTVAKRRGKNPDEVLKKVKQSILKQFTAQLKQQALQHTRHRVKKLVEVKIDKKFASITELEQHMGELPAQINPRGMYEEICREFRGYVTENDYLGVLKVFNCKPMLNDCNVAGLCGFERTERYINFVMGILKGTDSDAMTIRNAIKRAFALDKQP